MRPVAVSAFCKRKDFAPQSRRRVCEQIASAVAYMHSKQIAHRDLTPQNILIKRVRPNIFVKVIVGFGSATNGTGPRHPSYTGAKAYQPREVLLRARSSVVSGSHAEGRICPFRGDVFSLGVTISEVMTGIHPFGSKPSEQENRIYNGAPPTTGVDRNKWPYLSRLIDATVNHDAQRRPNNATKCWEEYSDFFQMDRRRRNPETVVRSVVPYVVGGFCGQKVKRLREMAKRLNDKIVHRLEQQSTGIEWYKCIETIPELPLQSKTKAMNVCRQWNGEDNRVGGLTFLQEQGPLPGLGLVKWIKDVFSHVSELASRGVIQTPLEFKAAVFHDRFPFLKEVLFDFVTEEDLEV